MPAPAIRYDGHAVDLSSRFFSTATVTGSPAAAAETIICTLTIGENVSMQKAVYVAGWCAFTMGTSGVSARLRLRQTDTNGTTLADTGAVTGVAAALYSPDIQGVDAAATFPGQVYVLTLLCGSAAAISTVSAASLIAVVV